jgi:glutaredoxin
MKKIIIYTTSWCPWCQKTKKFLENLGYSYEERNVELNPEWEKELIEKSGQMGVPVTLIIDENGKEKLVIGYDPLSLKEALE